MMLWTRQRIKYSQIQSWGKSHGELALLYKEYLAIFVHDHNCFQPECFCSISEVSRQDCYNWFCITWHNLWFLFTSWCIHGWMTTQSSHNFTREECFTIFLFHLIKGVSFTKMARHTLGGNPWYFSQMGKHLINHLYETFYNKTAGSISGFCFKFLVESL